MKSADSYDLYDAIEALNEKCLGGYRIGIYFDPRDKTSWITWSPPGATAAQDAGRGVHGSIFAHDVFTEVVRHVILDIERIKNLSDFKKHHEPPTFDR